MWSPKSLANLVISNTILFMSEKYDPNIHHRRSTRLSGYDYSQEGWYFVTICTQNRNCLFGEIVANQVRSNNAGLMVEMWWRKVTDKFPSVRADECVVMPSHFHAIINIVGATPCGRPDICARPIPGNTNNKLGQSHRIAPTLGNIVNWFKTMTTNQYIQGVKQNRWPPFPGRLWQRNYYEHIIRSEGELNHYRRYIADNPADWQTDKENPQVRS